MTYFFTRRQKPAIFKQFLTHKGNEKNRKRKQVTTEKNFRTMPKLTHRGTRHPEGQDMSTFPQRNQAPRRSRYEYISTEEPGAQ